MLQLLEAIRHIIGKFIVGEIQITSNISAGTTNIPVQTSRRYSVGDEIVIYNEDTLASTGMGEIRNITCIVDRNTIQVNEPLVDSYTTSKTKIQKVIDGRFIHAIHIGDPGVVQMYPAISINAVSEQNSWLTIESTQTEFNVEITAYTEAADYEQSYRMLFSYLQTCSRALWRSLYPLVEPYDCAILANDITADSTIIRITDQNDLTGGQLGFIFLESWDHLRYNKVKTVLEPGVFQLYFAATAPFAAGSKVIRPRRHFFNAFPRGIQYGTINNQSAVLKGGKISYLATEEVRRYYPYHDPLAF